MMMMTGSSGKCRFPFTASQWEELEHQALVFKYMVHGLPIPTDLLFTIRRSLDSKFLLHQPQHIGWNSIHMGFGRKIDPEPGRCRRTDGKKWRCSKEAYPDSKYCERHMHRGRNRSRKPVEETLSTAASPSPLSVTTTTTTTTTTSVTKNTHHFSPSSPTKNSVHFAPSESHFLYPHFIPSRPPGFSLSPQENTAKFLLESSNAYHSHPQGKDHRNSYGRGMIKEEGDEHPFFSDANSHNSCQLEPLTMGSSSSSLSQTKQKSYSSVFGSGQQIHNHDYYTSDMQVERDHQHQHKKIMHHFLDEWPPKDRDSNSEEKLSSHRTQLSMSIPNSLHDFFMTQK